MSKDVIDALRVEWNEERPDLDSEAMGVVLRIQALDKILGAKAGQRLQEFGLQWWQYDVLSALRRQGKPYTLAATELATANRLTSGAMTNRIDRLADQGLLRRLRDPRDRRRVLVQLTDAGAQLVDRASEARFEIAENALSVLSQRQQQQLGNLLRRLLLGQEGPVDAG